AAGDPALLAFYRARGFAPVWTTAADAGRRQALFGALERAGDHGLPAARYDAGALRAAFAAVRSEHQRGAVEAATARTFLAYARDLSRGAIAPASTDAGIVRDLAPLDPGALLAGLANAGRPEVYLRGLAPQAPEYGMLMKARMDLDRAIAAGGWGGAVPAAGKLEPGDSGPAVIALRDRLVAMGYLRRSAAATFDGPLQKAVQRFQLDHGLTPDGVAGDSTIGEINTPPEARLGAVLVAMERLRWLNGTALGRRHIWVNIPDFSAKIIDDGKTTFETVTVVGMNQPDRRSPEFSDQMEYMVVNPTWNVPRSISVKEYLPMLQKNPNAVSHLRIVDRQGRLVNRAETDFNQFTTRTFPYSISQPPSDDNALGLVKFMFPNQWNIYLHDTPSKSLFGREVRAFSHGCVRLGKPFDFAYTLLAPQVADPVAEFERHLRTGRETVVPLVDPVPVHLVYFTAWPDARGRIEYRRDIYGRDARILAAMEAAGLVLPGVRG
ncbi:MAG: murein L,D-transpeptidase, partial [Alphaproteobacteria bacterium HGW-Alphaproteobacteria-6]